MRIISGKYKGHHLVSFQADHIRPTTDRVKESLFNILMHEISNAKVLDLFSGTGSLGLESLSRGAAEVTFVEKNKKSLNILQKNLEKLKVNEPYTVVTKDVLKYLQTYQGDPFDIILADPPFTEAIAHDVLMELSQSICVGPNTWIAIESSRKERLDENYGKLTRFDKREFGDKFLSFFGVKK